MIISWTYGSFFTKRVIHPDGYTITHTLDPIKARYLTFWWKGRQRFWIKFGYIGERL